MNFRPSMIACLSALVVAGSATAATNSVSDRLEPPYIMREFRGAWIATVANLDWPSEPGLPVANQKSELIAILDRAVKLNLNAVILQVSPCCDAFYESKIAPWSYYLTGLMGKAPSPFYDPLRFAIEEAHKRGLELHAWFSPYRAGHPSDKPPVAANHVSRVLPHMVRRYADGKSPWLDPGEKEVQDYALSVVMEVVNGYNIDGVHFDDRMGYPFERERGRPIEFPDGATWMNYVAGGGKLAKDDWRRENVNTLVRQVYTSIKAVKPWVKFGIAPAGIWQPGYPAQIEGQNNYAVLYTDSRKWLAEGWVDYLSPQLYWPVNQRAQSFPVLLKWWLEQNPKHRNVWPGLTLEHVGAGWKADEIVKQVEETRRQRGGSAGTIMFRAKYLMDNQGGITSALMKELFARPALVPASAWLDRELPAKPTLKVENERTAKWETAPTEQIALWILQTRTGDQWQTSILPGQNRSQVMTGTPEVVSIKAIDRCGVASSAVIWQRSVPGETVPDRGSAKTNAPSPGQR